MKVGSARRRHGPVHLLLAGEGPLRSAYASALRRLGDAGLVRIRAEPGGPAGAGGAPRETPDAPPQTPFAAVVVAGGTESFSLASRALLAGKHVLVSGPGVLSPRQVRTLEWLAESRSRLLVFAAPRLLSRSAGFLRKMLAEGDGLWLPVYLRSLSASAPTRHGSEAMASLAMEDLALCLHVLNRPALSVSAVGTHSSGAAAAFLSVTFAGRVVASLQVSLAEAREERQLVVALADRTLLLDESDPRFPLKVISDRPGRSGDGSGPTHGAGNEAWTDVGVLSGREPPTEPIVEQCRLFAEAVAQDDLSQSNAGFWAEVAGLWEAAERSMVEGGVPVAVRDQGPGNAEARRSAPRLRLIRSGGRVRRRAALPAPTLTMVGG